jgi:hypothetical protein
MRLSSVATADAMLLEAFKAFLGTLIFQDDIGDMGVFLLRKSLP